MELATQNPTQNHMEATLFTAGENLQNFAGSRDAVTIGLVLSGAITVQLAGTSYFLSANEIFTAAPNTVHGLVEFSQDAQLLLLTFSMDMIRTQPEHFFFLDFWLPLSQGTMALPPHLPASHPSLPALQSLLTNLLHTTDRLQRFVFLMEICLQLIPCCAYPPENQLHLGIENRNVRLCMIYIINFYHRNLRLAQIARYAKCHPNYLCAIFKAYTGQTVMEYLCHIRVEAAAELLRTEDMSINKIAELTGFSSRNMFYKKFRQITGLSPTTYRKKYTIYNRQMD